MAIKIQNSTIIDNDRIIVNASKVGIGTTNPTEKLDVRGNLKISGGIGAGGTTGTSGQVLKSTGDGLEWGVVGGSGWTAKSANYTASNGDQIIADTSGGSWTLTLPSSPVVGNTVKIADGQDWYSNPLTVARNGSTIDGYSDDFSLNIKGITVDFIYDGTTWEVFANTGPEGKEALWTTVTTDTQAYSRDRLLAVATSTPFTITLPNVGTGRTTGSFVRILDGANWSSIGVTVARNGATIEGVAEDMNLNIGNIEVEFAYDGTTWNVYPSIGAANQLATVDDISSSLLYPVMVSGVGTGYTGRVSTSKLSFSALTGNLGIGTTNPTSKLTVQDDVLVSGTTTSKYFDGFFPGGDKVYNENTTINNNRVNIALESDIIVQSGKTLIVSAGSTIVLNPFDFENSSVDELLIDKRLLVGVSSSFDVVTSGIGSVGSNSTSLVGFGTVVPPNIAAGLLVKEIPGVIAAGTTVVSFVSAGSSTGFSTITISPASVNTTVQENITFKFGSFGENKSSIILDGETGVIKSGSNTVIIDGPNSKITIGDVDLGGSDGAFVVSDGTNERLRIDDSGFISFNGDINTGFSSPAADTLAARTNGTERMRIDSAGRIGVGVTNPTAQMHLVLSGDTPNPVLQVTRANNASGGVGNDEVGIAVTIPNTYNSAGTVYGVRSYVNHNLGGQHYAGHFVAGGMPYSNGIGVYAKTTHTDTNGPGFQPAILADAYSNIGVSNAGYAVALQGQTNNYVNNVNLVLTSNYTGALAQTLVRFERNGSYIGFITCSTTAVSYQTSSSSGLFAPDANTITLNTNSIERVRITSDGYLRMAASTGGIQFNGDTAAANALNDYEEGTWNPTIIGSSTAGTVTYAQQFGRYTKVGRIVHIEGYIDWSAGTGTGDLRISGLPFTVNNASVFPGLSIGYFANIAYTAGNVPVALFESNLSYIRLSQIVSGGGAETKIPYDAAGGITFGGSYSVQ
jgi:hypothetical protein